MHAEIVDLYEEHVYGSLDRRGFLKRLAFIAGGTAAAYSILAQLENNAAVARVVPEDDPRLHTETVLYPGATGDMRAYWARPKGKEELPGVIVIHENRGLNAIYYILIPNFSVGHYEEININLNAYSSEK